MHRYKAVSQILLIFSILNLVFAAPVVREIRDAHNDVVAPVVKRNVAAVSKERRGASGSDGSTPSDSSPSPPDVSTPEHSSPPLADGSTALHEGMPPLGGPAALAVSSPPGEIVPASDQPVPGQSTAPKSKYTEVTHAMLEKDPPIPPPPETNLKKWGPLGAIIAFDTVAIAVTTGLIWHKSHKNNNNNRRRMIGPPDCSTAKGSRDPFLDD